MAAEVTGVLLFDESTNCLLMELEGVQYPLVWPAGTRWQENPPTVVLKDGEKVEPGFEDADTSVVAAVPFYGVYDFTNRAEWRAGLEGVGFRRFLERRVMKVSLADDPADSRGILSWHAQPRDGRLQRDVALKFLAETLGPEARQFLLREARAASASGSTTVSSALPPVRTFIAF